MIIVTPQSVEASTEWFKKINKSGIPVIGSNTTPEDEGFKYLVGWAGPDDWAQFRLLAHDFAERMNYEGGYCVNRHMVGNSNFYSRTFSIITELKKIAPKMECLAMESAVEYDNMKSNTENWLRQFGDRLKGMVSSEPGDGLLGMCEAIEKAGRDDIIKVSAGNSETSQDLVKKGRIHATTYQSAEADGALALELAIDWFNGLNIPPARYLPMHIITKEDVDDFNPTQW